MNKTELVAAMAEKAGLTKTDAANALNAYVEVVKEELAKGGSISLIGFGTFSVKENPARTGRNPRTKETIQIAAKKVAKFKAGKGLL
ncbi:MAG: HU family DNA-binding protein [Bacteroidales bacterium]|nr:HU family DNA-binding protein [Candidatus Colimorpha merdihippi]MCQ2274726.1 HU family DNA-binding protein [Bacteroidales bacterium]MCQ2281340.1 HU family DNA-binding protein [Bacteroidales bacterium]